MYKNGCSVNSSVCVHVCLGDLGLGVCVCTSVCMCMYVYVCRYLRDLH